MNKNKLKHCFERGNVEILRKSGLLQRNKIMMMIANMVWREVMVNMWEKEADNTKQNIQH